MGRVWGMLLAVRAWLIAAVIWIIAASALHRDGEDPNAGAGFATFLVFFLGGLGFVRVLWPMRATASMPPRLSAGGRILTLATYTGRVGDHSKLATTTFQAESRAHERFDGSIGHTLHTSQRVSVRDGLTLHGADGTQFNVQVDDANLAVGRGQLFSAAWALRMGTTRRGKYVLFRNHTTGTVSVPVAQAWRLAAGRGAVAIVLCLFLGGLIYFGTGYPALGAVAFFVLPFLYIGLAYYRVSRFRGGLGRPLVDFLDGVAATFTAPAAASIQAASPQGPESAPAVPPPPPGRQVPPGWLPDPAGRHEYRYWDGARWSDQVSDAGRQQTDPA